MYKQIIKKEKKRKRRCPVLEIKERRAIRVSGTILPD
jgi:hypothetical protein